MRTKGGNLIVWNGPLVFTTRPTPPHVLHLSGFVPVLAPVPAHVPHALSIFTKTLRLQPFAASRNESRTYRHAIREHGNDDVLDKPLTCTSTNGCRLELKPLKSFPPKAWFQKLANASFPPMLSKPDP